MPLEEEYFTLTFEETFILQHAMACCQIIALKVIYKDYKNNVLQMSILK